MSEIYFNSDSEIQGLSELYNFRTFDSFATDVKKDSDKQIESYLYLADFFPKNKTELLKKAKRIFSSIKSRKIKGSSLKIFANYYIENKDAKNLRRMIELMKGLIIEISLEKRPPVKLLITLLSYEAEASLLENAPSSFNLQLTKMKQLSSMLSDLPDILEVYMKIENLEERGKHLFDQDQLVMHALKV